jgi:hypothetical protein
VGSVAESNRNLRQLGFTEFARNELSDVFLLMGMLDEVPSISFDCLIKVLRRGFNRSRKRP